MGNGLYITEKSRKNVENLSKFLSENDLQREFNQVLKDKIRKDLREISRSKGDMPLNRAVRVQENWYGELIAAIINSSRTADPRRIGSNFDIFDFDDADELTSKVMVKTRFDELVTVAGGEFSSKITFHSDNEDILRLLEIKEVGGELHIEGGGEDDEKKTYTFNASRGSEMTSRIENRISESLKTYFSTNFKDINDEIGEKFSEWAKKNDIKIEKGR